jgi:hypothetical protein
MVLKFPTVWRFHPPRGGSLNTEHIPEYAINDFLGLIRKTATQGDLQDFLEHFKRFFCATNGNPHSRSSSAGWADTDLQSEMSTAAANPPLFLEAFFDACEAIRKRPGDLFAPDAAMINEICRKYNIGYKVEPPDLILVDKHATLIPVPERPLTLAEKAQEILQSSLHNAEQLLAEGKDREAVQEALWLIETVATAFRGIDTGTGTIEGKYFNQIVKELRDAYSGKTLDMVLQWVTNLHGYLSSPTGGGVRHGLDLKEGLKMTPSEARLFCNLIRSYLSFLLTEHERLAGHTRKIR